MLGNFRVPGHSIAFGRSLQGAPAQEMQVSDRHQQTDLVNARHVPYRKAVTPADEAI